MADNKKYYDENGIELKIGESRPAAPPKQYFDLNGSPIQLNPSGVKQPLGSETYTPQTTGSAEQAAPYAMRLGANSLPMVGSTLFGVPGTIGGSVVKQVLQRMAPNAFGQPPGDPVFDGATDVVLNDAVPGMAGLAKAGYQNAKTVIPQLPLLRNFPSVRQAAVGKLTDMLMGQNPRTQSQILTDAATEVNMVPNAAQTAERNLVGQDFGNTLPGRFRTALRNLAAGKGSYSVLAEKGLEDVQSVRSLKLAVSPQFVEELAINDLLTKNYGAADKVLDTKRVLDTLGKSAPLQEAFRTPESLGKFTEALSEIHNLQKTQRLDGMIAWASGKLKFMVPSMLISGPLGVATKAAGGIAITNKMLARMMSNPETADLFIEAMRTPAGTPKANLLGQALKGILTPDRSKVAIGIRAAEDFATVPEK